MGIEMAEDTGHRVLVNAVDIDRIYILFVDQVYKLLQAVVPVRGQGRQALYDRAKKFRDERIVTANTLDEYKALFPVEKDEEAGE